MVAKKAAGGGARTRATRKVEGPKGARAVYFLSLILENVRCFGPAQTLDLSDGEGRPRQWTVILGNNGVGKTTLLQALAGSAPEETVFTYPVHSRSVICSLGESSFPIDSDELLRSKEMTALIKGRFGLGAALSNASAEFQQYELHISLKGEGEQGKSGNCVDDLELATFCCFGYGATRRMGASALSEPGADDPILTLFRDDVPLRNAEEWLLQADYAASKPSPHRERARARRDSVRSMLIDLLPDVDDIEILADLDDNAARPRPGIRLKTPYGWVPLHGLSLGYKTLLAWMVDLASRLHERYPESENPLAEPAVVLVDEIDLHLHPAWQRTLLDYLSRRFPNVQFVVTAHSPLVVQAATDANVVVLRREGDHVVIDNGAAAVRSWRIDQILTSDLFGLPSARPPVLDPLLAERRKLLTKPRLSAADRRALERIEQEIGELPTGETPEQMEAMDIIARAARSLKKASGGAA
ncbi:AAA family ATPase [Sorangium sp. So ce1389]|uniref:AAA family ATPase n=1 Tax=Sorangium sp. So ce1389 TaxID=3133336 RepID=UPI003F5E0804